jgi:putative membrane protein
LADSSLEIQFYRPRHCDWWFLSNAPSTDGLPTRYFARSQNVRSTPARFCTTGGFHRSGPGNERLSMISLIVKWLLSALILLAITYIVPGFRVVSLPSAMIAVLVIGLLNMTLGLFLKAITLPFAILTLGLFFLVINALMLIVASKITPGLQISNFGAAFVGAFFIAVAHIIMNAVL